MKRSIFQHPIGVEETERSGETSVRRFDENAPDRGDSDTACEKNDALVIGSMSEREVTDWFRRLHHFAYLERHEGLLEAALGDTDGEGEILFARSGANRERSHRSTLVRSDKTRENERDILPGFK